MRLKLLDKVFSNQFLIFLSIGGICAIADYAITMICQYLWFFLPIGAKICGFIVGTSLALWANSKFTFQKRFTRSTLTQAVFLYGITFIIQIGIYTACSAFFPEKEIYSTIFFVIAQGVATSINFLAQKFIIFS